MNDIANNNSNHNIDTVDITLNTFTYGENIHILNSLSLSCVIENVWWVSANELNEK